MGATDFFRTCAFAFIADTCFLCLTHLWPTFPFYIPQKHPRTTCSSAPPEGINWEHHQPNETIIDWPKYDQIPPFHAPWKHQKTKGPPTFPGGYKTGRSARQGSNDKIKKKSWLFSNGYSGFILRGEIITTARELSKVLIQANNWMKLNVTHKLINFFAAISRGE